MSFDPIEIASKGIPHFNLAEMGLPAIPMDGTTVHVETEVSAIRRAMRDGNVKLTVNVDMGAPVPVDIVPPIAYVPAYNVYQGVGIFSGGSNLYAISVNITSTGVNACVFTLL